MYYELWTCNNITIKPLASGNSVAVLDAVDTK